MTITRHVPLWLLILSLTLFAVLVIWAGFNVAHYVEMHGLLGTGRHVTPLGGTHT